VGRGSEPNRTGSSRKEKASREHIVKSAIAPSLSQRLNEEVAMSQVAEHHGSLFDEASELEVEFGLGQCEG
jgi:hypothetical protein